MVEDKLQASQRMYENLTHDKLSIYQLVNLSLTSDKLNEWPAATYFWKQINKCLFQKPYPKSVCLVRKWVHLNMCPKG